MKKVNRFENISALHLVGAFLFAMACDTNMVYGYAVVLLLVGAWGFSEIANEELRKYELTQHLEENGEGID